MPTEIRLTSGCGVYTDLEPAQVRIELRLARVDRDLWHVYRETSQHDIYVNPDQVVSMHECEVRNAETRRAQRDAMLIEEGFRKTWH